MPTNDLITKQAQPTKIRLKGHDNEKYQEKLLAKANVISSAANRLWGKRYVTLRKDAAADLLGIQMQAEMELE